MSCLSGCRCHVSVHPSASFGEYTKQGEGKASAKLKVVRRALSHNVCCDFRHSCFYCWMASAVKMRQPFPIIHQRSIHPARQRCSICFFWVSMRILAFCCPNSLQAPPKLARVEPLFSNQLQSFTQPQRVFLTCWTSSFLKCDTRRKKKCLF